MSAADVIATQPALSRELLLHALYEAAELEHNLMCTYLYAAFSLRDGEAEGLSQVEAAAVARWRSPAAPAASLRAWCRRVSAAAGQATPSHSATEVMPRWGSSTMLEQCDG
jgi:hypothetical protein